MKKLFIIGSILISLFASSSAPIRAGQSISVEPLANDVPLDSAFTFGVYLTGSAIRGFDLALRFDPAYVRVLSVLDDRYFDHLVTSIPPVSTTIYIRGASNAGTGDKSPDHVRVARILFRAIRAGDKSFSMTCQPANKNDTNMWDAVPADTVDCTVTTQNPGRVRINDPTPTPTVIGAPTATAGPTIPPSGSTPSCDLCGKCIGEGGIEQTPSNWKECHECLYLPSGEIRGGYTHTPIGCIPTSAPAFVQTVFNFIISIGGGLTFLAILYGGFLFITSKGDVAQKELSKQWIIRSLGAFLFIVLSFFILRFMGVDVIQIPGFR